MTDLDALLMVYRMAYHAIDEAWTDEEMEALGAGNGA